MDYNFWVALLDRKFINMEKNSKSFNDDYRNYLKDQKRKFSNLSVVGVVDMKSPKQRAGGCDGCCCGCCCGGCGGCVMTMNIESANK